MTDEIPMTIDNLVDDISLGLPLYQRAANHVFVTNLHHSLKDGGTWISPALRRIFRKEGEGFVELLTDDMEIQ